MASSSSASSSDFSSSSGSDSSSSCSNSSSSSDSETSSQFSSSSSSPSSSSASSSSDSDSSLAKSAETDLKRLLSAIEAKLKAMKKLQSPTLNLSSPSTCSSQVKKTKPFHKSFICFHSPFFAAAFNNLSFVEGQTQTMDLQDTDPAVFGMFVNWLYTQKFVNSIGNEPTVTSLLKLWILGDKFLAHKLQNKTMDKLDMLRLQTHSLPSGDFRYVYENTAVNSPLRRYLVDYRSICFTGPLADEDDYPPQMLVDIINAMRENTRTTAWNRNPAMKMKKYHLGEIEERANKSDQSDDSESDSTTTSSVWTDSVLDTPSSDSDTESDDQYQNYPGHYVS